MDLGSILILGALAYGVYYFTQGKGSQDNQDDQDYKTKYEDEKQRNEQLQNAVDELEDKVNPNTNEHQPNLSITSIMQSGGLTLSHNSIELVIRNNSSIDVELGDFRCDLYLAGVKSLKLMPANNGQIVIGANKTVTYKMYARGGEAIQDVGEVKRMLNKMLGDDKKKFSTNTFIPIQMKPVELDVACFWFWKGNDEKLVFYNVPGSFKYRYDGWTVGTPWVGYNAASESQRKNNPSLWDDEN